MDLRLVREPSTDGCTLGRLCVDGVFACFTLEDVIRDVKIPGQTAIPAGRYRVAITASETFGRMLPQLLEVPGFSGIRIHAGNTARDTAGCILVGHSRGVASVLDSRLALGQLQPRIAGALARGDSVWIEIVNPSRSDTRKA